VDAETLRDAENLAEWTKDLEAHLNALKRPGERFMLTTQSPPDQPHVRIELVRLRHGIPETSFVPAEFFRGTDYLRIADLGEKLQGLLEVGAYVQRGERRIEVSTFGEGIEWLLDDARRGYHIQRYKGLGEMNPDQLWETTMDPETRRLLRVTIEDVVAADQVFTTLMGDQVEPRRDFIERNALAAENIDV
jgi:DNA gyrase subunit B